MSLSNYEEFQINNLKKQMMKFAKLAGFLITFLLVGGCADKQRNHLLYLVHNDDAKRWEKIGINDSIFESGRSSECVIFYSNHTYKEYVYYKNGDVKLFNPGDIDIPNYYDIISDSLFHWGNTYQSILKLSNDTLILSFPCDGGLGIYKASNLRPDDKRIYNPQSDMSMTKDY